MTTRSSQPLSVTDALREAVESGPLTQRELARVSGVPESVISRFRNRLTAPSASAIDLLSAALGLELRPVKSRSARAENPTPTPGSGKPGSSNKPRSPRAGTAKKGAR